MSAQNLNLFQLAEAGIPGYMELRPHIHDDSRGRFVKVFQQEFFAVAGLCANFTEDFYSISHRHVIRGLHFQIPPADHAKLVYCVAGQVQDVVVDIRVGSPAFGRYAVTNLSAKAGNMLYIPPGLAHGFCTLSETATVLYKTSTSHSPAHDQGILWNSADIPWATDNPILSDRDRSYPSLREFNSPFVFGSGH